MSTENSDELWKTYLDNPSQENRNILIEKYAYLVKIAAKRASTHINGLIEFDDLVGFGIFGLIDAISKYSLDMNTKFDTYAMLRIQGSILDEIRKLDTIPRSIRDKKKQYNSIYNKAIDAYNRTPTREELVKTSELSEKDFNLLEQKSDAHNYKSLESIYESEDLSFETDKDLSGHTTFVTPECAIDATELKKR